MKKIILLISIFIPIFISCKKESGPNVKTENPIKTITQQQTVIDTVKLPPFFGSYEMGNKFYVSRNGNITKLGCRMPWPGNYRVSLWHFDTKYLIAAANVVVTDSFSSFVYANINPIAITTNTRYVLSISNFSFDRYKLMYLYYKRSTPIDRNIYPFTTGSITFEDYRELNTSLPTFPTNVSNQRFIIGVPDLQFEYTE